MTQGCWHPPVDVIADVSSDGCYSVTATQVLKGTCILGGCLITSHYGVPLPRGPTPFQLPCFSLLHT
jgi:hypothetical protein